MMQVHFGLRIPLRDGVHLSATVYLPDEKHTNEPAVFVMTPYTRQTHHERGVYFATHGLTFVTVDVRGRGDSQGEFHPRNEARDACDAVAWLACQPYCNGKVAMWGGSYMGYVQWAAAKEFPPALSTIVPASSPFRGLDSPMRNNIGSSSVVRWLALLAGRTAQEAVFADSAFWNERQRLWLESGTAFEQLDSFVGYPSPIFQEWIAHPQLDEYWDEYNPTAQHYACIDIPVLTITGTYDGNQTGALAHYRQHLANNPGATHYLIIGPWDHAGTRTPKLRFCGLTAGPESLIDLPLLHLQWYQWTLRGGSKPVFLRDKVAYYVMGLERWRYTSSLDAVTAYCAALYLCSTVNPSDVFVSGSLENAPLVANNSPDHYVYDPCDTRLSELEMSVDPANRTDQRMLHAATGRQLIYHTGPFEQAVEISGFFNLTLWISIDQPDTDFHVAIYDIGLDGGSVQLTTDCLRARYRKSLREAVLIENKDVLRYDFERFTFVSRRIDRGHRLRLVVGPNLSMHMQRNFNGGGVVVRESAADARVAIVKVFHDAAHPSALHIPFGQTET